MNNIVSIGQFGQLSADNLRLVTKDNGAATVGLLSKKEYGERHGLKGAALNQAHFDYKRDAMQANAKMVGAALLTGEIGITRIGCNAKKDGGSLSFKSMASLKAPKTKGPDLSKVELSDIMAFLESKGYEVAVK